MRTSKPLSCALPWLFLLAGAAFADPVTEPGVPAPAVDILVEADTQLELPPESEADGADGSDTMPITAQEQPDELPPASEDSPTPEIMEAQQRLLEIEQTGGPDSLALIDALEALAVAEIRAGQFSAAESSLTRAIETIERNSGVYAQRLAKPLALLGELYIDQDKLDEAVEAYRRAQHVTHRADGVYTLEQLDYLEKISSVFIKKRKYAEADRHKNFSYFVSEQNYGPDSPELVPAMMKLGGWFQQVGKTREARKMFERATDVLEEAYGPEHPSLIEPLLALGSATRKRGQYRKQREAALQRVVSIVEKTGSMDAADKAVSWAQLGDFYILVDQPGRAAEAYARGWDELQKDAALPAADRRFLGEPKLLHFQRRMYLMENTPRATVEGYSSSLQEFPLEIEFEVSIGDNGRVEAARAVNLNATSTTKRQLRRYVREARFRPPIVDGKPVRTDNYRFKEMVIIVRPEGN